MKPRKRSFATWSDYFLAELRKAVRPWTKRMPYTPERSGKRAVQAAAIANAAEMFLFHTKAPRRTISS